MKNVKTAISVLAATAIAGAASASASGFVELDANVDGQVTFEEYRAVATAKGKTSTLAASEFTKMTQGDAILTEDEFLMATAFETSSELDVMPAPLTDNAIETVAPVATFEAYPADAEAMTATTEIETESVVAGEIATSDEMIFIEPVETPALELETEVDTETDITLETPEQDIDIPQAPELPKNPGDIY